MSDPETAGKCGLSLTSFPCCGAVRLAADVVLRGSTGPVPR